MKPKVILYVAASLDGRTQGFSVNMELFYSLAQQWNENASLIGCNTLLSASTGEPVSASEAVTEEKKPSQPSSAATDKSEYDPRPILVVPDSQGRLKNWPYWQKQPYWKDCVSLSTSQTPAEHLAYLAYNNIKIIKAGVDHINFTKALNVLSEQFSVTLIRVDSGGILNRVLLQAGLVDELHLLVHPFLVGSGIQKKFFNDLGAEERDGISLSLIDVQKKAKDIVLLSYAVSK
ncbi:MAG: dihydrofolate reductase family protein [Cyanobacteria bacterium J06581_3]